MGAPEVARSDRRLLLGKRTEDGGRLAARLARPRDLDRQRLLEVRDHLVDRQIAVARLLCGRALDHHR